MNGSDAAGQDPPAGAVELVSEVRDNPFPFEWYRLTLPEHFWFRWRLAAALRAIRAARLPLDRPLRGLEVGAGTGVLRAQLEAATGWSIDITDLQLDALRLARPGRGRVLYYDVTEERAGFVGAYDLVVLFDVLEHVGETRPFLESLLRHLRPGGALLINVPALQALFSPYDTAAGHQRRYDRGTLAGELDGLGVEVATLSYWGASLVPLLVARKLLLAFSPRDAAQTIATGFQPPGPLSHAALTALMRVELALWPAPPVGTSLMLVGRRSR